MAGIWIDIDDPSGRPTVKDGGPWENLDDAVYDALVRVNSQLGVALKRVAELRITMAQIEALRGGTVPDMPILDLDA